MQEFEWAAGRHRFTVPFERRGQGPPVLLLPALSTASTQEEMRPLARELADHFGVVTVDWPGFGRASRLPARYGPDLLARFLRDFAAATFEDRVAGSDHGHAAGYVMRVACDAPGIWSRAALVCPTWRGPLPAAMGERRGLYDLLRRVVGLPVLGPPLYRLNTTRFFLRLMYRRHVYGDAGRVTPALMREKQRVARQPGARFGAAAFVTGTLDPVRSRAAFLELFRPLPLPVMAIIGKESPRRSRAEMEALVSEAAADADGLNVRRLPGALGLHEERPKQLAAAIQPFLAGAASPS